MKSRPPKFYQRRLKRPLDITISAILLVLLSPLILLIGCFVLLALGRPILFIDRRGGRSGRPFGCWKFRTMTNERDGDGKLLGDDLRRTALGDWLRAISLDELPQLWNVLMGQMSLVGPRPLTADYLDRYSPDQQRRHDVRPGITGWAQVNGGKAVSWERKFELDAWYVERVSLPLDARIVMMTLWQLLALGRIRDAAGNSETDFVGSEPPPA